MPSYEVMGVLGERRWEGNYGQMKTVTLALRDVPKAVELNMKPETPNPSNGERLELELSENSNPQFSDKLKAKKVQPQGGGFGRGGGGGRSPEESDRISRMNAQGHAVTYALAQAQLGKDVPLERIIGEIAERFFEAAKNPQQQMNIQNPQVPQRTSDIPYDAPPF